jgi:hypothetical protein
LDFRQVLVNPSKRDKNVEEKVCPSRMMGTILRKHHKAPSRLALVDAPE